MNIDDAIKNLLVSMGDVQPKIFVRIFDGNRVILVKSDSGI
ncbi:putative bfpG [Escherichia coli 3-267-03_S4_C2]|nr:putative bfpG [Escherichia coli 3-267-03_S4_C2]